MLRRAGLAATLAGLSCLTVLLVVDAMAGPALCVQDLLCRTAPGGSECVDSNPPLCDDPGPSPRTTALASLAAALLAGILRARR